MRHFTDILLFFSFLLYIVLRFVSCVLSSPWWWLAGWLAGQETRWVYNTPKPHGAHSN